MTFCWTAMVRLLRLWSVWVASSALARRMSRCPSTKSSSPHAIRATVLAAVQGRVELVLLERPGRPGRTGRPELAGLGPREPAALRGARIPEPVLALALEAETVEPLERVAPGPARLAAAQVCRTRS